MTFYFEGVFILPRVISRIYRTAELLLRLAAAYVIMTIELDTFKGQKGSDFIFLLCTEELVYFAIIAQGGNSSQYETNNQKQ